MNKDPGQQAIAFCSAKYSEMMDNGEFYEQRKDEVIAEAFTDCTLALVKADEFVIIETLAEIGNNALRIQRNGDTDDKIAFVDSVCDSVFRLIRQYAEAQAERDLEKHLSEDQ